MWISGFQECSRIHSNPEAQEIADINNVSTLVEQLRKGRFTAENVVLAYIGRAVIAHQLVGYTYQNIRCYVHLLTVVGAARQIALQKWFLKMLWPRLEHWIIYSKKLVISKVHFTVFQSR
ncbi:uncharacterized protein BDW43DRAFT_264394 [Aspergillus alliaceus]|uniref:uncharacterized protein n=1 Tax=Petromyces alliaceus TaxID=209559 RepID=UPI0012A470E4|nr:uncharacterized protein BDW43DRAFT_264394 [Aspergillus alliaceus]KAB8237830.1 hypothetical protein BDW43DRAFT_264394 [Aspergillus alliaceus]